ncbi:MAG: hypothetical protein MR966_08000 [Lachnospiraceae bacterium]|nr:hypothetical protein [Lachnospiraceae bacterium]
MREIEKEWWYTGIVEYIFLKRVVYGKAADRKTIETDKAAWSDKAVMTVIVAEMLDGGRGETYGKSDILYFVCGNLSEKSSYQTNLCWY